MNLQFGERRGEDAAWILETVLGGVGFQRPEFLYLLVLLPFWWVLAWPRAGGGVLFARGDALRYGVGGWGVGAYLLRLQPLLLRSLVAVCLILALADPLRVERSEEFSVQGRGIGLVVDLSSSMLATDMEGSRSRIAVAREAAIRFAESRPLDELTLIGFAGEAITRVPPTEDPLLVVQGAETLEIQLVRDGTDISAALMTSVAELMASDREPRVAILLTDGAHNGTGLPPLAAARVAQAFGVRVHALSILGPEASDRTALVGAAAQSRARMEEEMRTVLRGIAEITGGQHFHATSGEALDSIYGAIDRMERPIEAVREVEDRRSVRGWPLLLGLLLLGAEVLLRGSRWGVIP